ncbi:hypothetical protein [Winogradskyella forsetii]|uniref:hypothetical protein n=1 Tax=Winogradskyella forsetii TaxID=2686077 RepID=UPI0015BDC4AF|nr:hypothetical protein [Winogradskyella forsetii]
MIFFTKKNKRQKTKALLTKYGLKIVKQKETALILCCFAVVPLKKKGKVNLTDENGNILEAGIKDLAATRLHRVVLIN